MLSASTNHLAVPSGLVWRSGNGVRHINEV